MIPRKRFFYLTSGTQLSETNSTFSAEIQIPDNEDYDRVVLTQCLIPLSYYTIANGQNVFVLTEGDQSVNITIPAGNYNTANFPLTVQSQLNINSPNGYNYTITYPDETKDTQTGKLTYTVDTGILPISFTFPTSSDLAIRFGFNIGSTDTFIINSDMLSTLISANIVDFSALNAILIHSNLVQDSYTDVLQDIYPTITEIATNISYLCPDPLAYSKKLSSSRIRYVTFSMTDEFNNPLYLNGLDIILTIMIYKEPEFFKKVEAYIKYKMTKELFNPDMISET